MNAVSAPEPDSIGMIGLGIFLIVAGILYLAEYVGWITAGLSWGVPIAAITWGAVLVVRHGRRLLAR